ncbi:MAG: FAD-dependent oxidoreductase [Bacteroidetes bacterium]|jgi:glycine/D-amino acid oxidase-like deaminating enzyme|nr:FAD-dependent oxidoreductase [Bacteroidota bacterium]
MNRQVTVIGAGVQGTCIALELANRGYKVDLLDQENVPFNRTSVRNEGKIHLGLVYMNDPDFETPFLMLKAAFQFSKNLSRWIGNKAKKLNIGSPFYYLVSKDSILCINELQKRYHKLQEFYEQRIEDDTELNYLGTTPKRLAKRSTKEELAKHFVVDKIQGGFASKELAIDTFKLAEYVVQAIENHPNITFLGGHKIHSISKNGSGYIVEGINAEGPWKMKSLQVVNATWTDKFRLDETLGIPAPQGILHRLKYRVIADIPAKMKDCPSATMVIGKFGDVVIRPDKTAYVSWYPDACRGWSNSKVPPETWDDPSRGNVSEKDFEMLSDLFITETAKWYPAIKNCKPKLVDAGVIVAHGETDVDHEESQLHKRAKIGVTSYDGYHSVETGKLTTAPMFAMDTADNVDRVLQQL